MKTTIQILVLGICVLILLWNDADHRRDIRELKAQLELETARRIAADERAATNDADTAEALAEWMKLVSNRLDNLDR